MNPPSRMKCLLKMEARESFHLAEVNVPQIGDDDVLLRVEKVALSQLDLPLYRWNKLAQSMCSLPFIPGHQLSGVVARRGAKSALAVGQRVALEWQIFCNRCSNCISGRSDLCEEPSFVGLGKGFEGGACAEYCQVPSSNCYPVHTDIGSDDICMLASLATVQNAVSQMELADARVLVTGANVLGLMALSLVRNSGAREIVVAGACDWRLERARKLGADVVVDTRTETMRDALGKLGDVEYILETTGAPEVVDFMFKLLRKGGSVMMIAYPKMPLTFNNFIDDLIMKNLTLKTCSSRRIFGSWAEAERLVATGRIDVTSLISERFPLSDFRRAYAALQDNNSGQILVDFTGSETAKTSPEVNLRSLHRK